MKYGLISDSHVPERASEIPSWVLEICSEQDRVVHAGDITSKTVYRELKQRFEDFTAVRGNCDRIELDESHVFRENAFNIGVYHGSGIKPRGDTDTLTRHIAEKLGCRILIHGHTHQQEAVKSENKILVNPGTCTGVGGGSSETKPPSMTTMRIKGDHLEIVEHRNQQVSNTERFNLQP